MQRWELERELNKCQDKLEAARDYFDTHCKGCNAKDCIG